MNRPRWIGVEATSLLESQSDERLADAYQWYVANVLASCARAHSAIERYTLNQLVQALPERWRLTLDEATTRRLKAMSEAVSGLVEDPARPREIRARDAFREVAALDEASRGDDLPELAERYGKIAEQYKATVYGERAGIRRQSLRREAGAGRH